MSKTKPYEITVEWEPVALYEAGKALHKETARFIHVGDGGPAAWDSLTTAQKAGWIAMARYVSMQESGAVIERDKDADEVSRNIQAVIDKNKTMLKNDGKTMGRTNRDVTKGWIMGLEQARDELHKLFPPF